MIRDIMFGCQCLLEKQLVIISVVIKVKAGFQVLPLEKTFGITLITQHIIIIKLLMVEP